MSTRNERFIVTRDSVEQKERADHGARGELAIAFAGLIIAAGAVHLMVEDIERGTEERQRHPIENVELPPTIELPHDIE